MLAEWTYLITEWVALCGDRCPKLFGQNGFKPQPTTHDVHLDVAMYGMLHSSLVSETQARREFEAEKSRSVAIAREMRGVARDKRRAARAQLRVDRANESLRHHDERIIDLRDAVSSTRHIHAPLPW